MEIGRVICALRKERNMTQEEVALSVGTDAGYLSRIERGDRLPSLKLLENIAKTLGTRPSVIYAAAEQFEVTSLPEVSPNTLTIFDVSEEGLNLRLIFRKLDKDRQRLAVDLLKVLDKGQSL